RAAIRRINYGDGPYPSLDLNFVGATVLDPRVEFERSSDAWRWNDWGLLESVGANEPRFQYDPVTGKSLGLLVERTSVNLLSRSFYGDGTDWAVGSSITVTPDYGPTNFPGKFSAFFGAAGEASIANAY